MWRVKRASQATLFVVIGTKRIECGMRVGGRWVPEGFAEVGIAEVDADTGIGAVCAALMQLSLTRAQNATLRNAASSVRHVHVVVADTWLALAVVPWSTALQSVHTSHAFARAQLTQAGLNVQTADTLRLDDAGFAQPRLAVAYSSALLVALRQLANGLGARLESVLPLSAAAWEVTRRPRRAGLSVLALVDHGLLMVLQGAGRLAFVTRRAGERRELPELWQRMMLRDPQSAQAKRPAVLDLVSSEAIEGIGPEFVSVELTRAQDAETASPRLHLAALSQSCRLAIDAVPASRPMTLARWAVALASVVVMGGLMTQAWRTTQQVQAVRAQSAAGRVSQDAAIWPATWSREELGRVSAVNAAIRELNLPVSALLLALQPPRDIRVAVLGVDVLGAGIKITGEARTGAEMARYVGFVASRRPFTGAYLTHHEIDESAPERPFRFTVEAAWND